MKKLLANVWPWIVAGSFVIAFKWGYLSGHHLLLGFQPQKAALCRQLAQTLEMGIAYGERIGSVEMREAIIASGQASPQRAWELYRTRKSSLPSIFTRESRGSVYRRNYLEWFFARAEIGKAFGCPFYILP